MRFGAAFFAIGLTASYSATPAFAQGPVAPEGWRVDVGGGALFAPGYVGDDDYRLSLLPNIQFRYADRFFASVQDGVGYNVVNQDGLRIGPIARIEFARNEDGEQAFAIAGDETQDLIGLGDVDATAELGGFAAYRLGEFEATVEARRGVNGHEGFVADLSLRYSQRNFSLGPPVIFSVGPRLKIVDDNYNAAYFSVDAAQSVASGLPTFDASGGVHSYGVGATLIAPLTRDNRLSAVFIAGYDRLAGDAVDAPLVRLRGARDQASVGVFFSYWLW